MRMNYWVLCAVFLLGADVHVFGVTQQEFLAGIDAQFQLAAAEKSKLRESFRPPAVTGWRKVELLVEHFWYGKDDIPLHESELRQFMQDIRAIAGFEELSYAKFYAHMNALIQQQVQKRTAAAAARTQKNAAKKEVPTCCFCHKRKHLQQKFLSNGCCNDGHGCFNCYLTQYFIKSECPVCRQGFSWQKVTRVLSAPWNRQKFHAAMAKRQREIDEENEANLARAIADSLAEAAAQGPEAEGARVAELGQALEEMVLSQEGDEAA